MRMRTLLIPLALALGAPIVACAAPGGYAGLGYGNVGVPTYGASPVMAPRREDDGLLSEPPADAKAGQCFAKVVVPGQPVYGPPAGAHLTWVQSPPPPGAIGPVWCQVWEQGWQPTVSFTPERYGWIRVICDKDATKEKIGHIQRRLHDWGYYQGGYSGQYDQGTAEAVKRFQAARHIEHGGYLSYQTVEALETAPAPQPMAPPVTYAQGYVNGGYGYSQQSYAPPVYQQPYAPCGPQPCAAPPPPCGPNPCQGGYAQGGYGQPAYSQSGERHWLTWTGKAGY